MDIINSQYDLPGISNLCQLSDNLSYRFVNVYSHSIVPGGFEIVSYTARIYFFNFINFNGHF